jgi:hypothetical protein
MLKHGAAAVFIGLLLVGGCAEEKVMTLPNMPPETFVAVADSVRNPTVYIQTVHWWGEDSDGEVEGFEYRWYTDPAETACAFDTLWSFTEETAMEFHLPVTQDTSVHSLEVRARDNDGAVDESPCHLELPLTNNPPVMMIWDRGELPDTTFPAIRIEWHADDPEGNETLAAVKVWLDGQENEARLISAADTAVSLGYDDFGGVFGTRTIYLQAIDSGCNRSNIEQHTWYVAEQTGNVLLIDDLPSSVPGYRTSDRLYREALGSCVDSPWVDAYSVLDIEGYGGVTYAHNFGELFAMFDLVVWYNDNRGAGSEDLITAEPAILPYIESGGRFVVIGMGVVGTGGALDSTYHDVFGINSLYENIDGTTGFDCKNWEIWGDPAQGTDSLKVAGIFLGAECMEPSAEAVRFYHLLPGETGPQQTTNYYVGLLNTWMGGRAAVLTFPLGRSDRYGNARNEFCGIVGRMLN